MFSLLSRPAAATLNPLGVGDVAPEFAFKTIEGKQGHVRDFRGWVVVYTAADRDTYEPLMNWQRRAGPAVASAHPDLKVVYINVANVSVVPSMMKGVVEPILKHLAEGAMADLRTAYSKEGLNLSEDRFQAHLIADWSGEVMQKFGLAKASPFRSWVATDRRIVGSFEPTEGGMERRFMSLFDEISRYDVH